MVVQGYLKNGSTPVAGSFRMGFLVKKNGSSIYCYQTAASAVTVTAGVFNYTLKDSNASACGGAGLAAELALVDFAADDVTVDVVVDTENNGIGTGTDASFTNLDIVASPFAMVANVAKVADVANGVAAGSLMDSHINASAAISAAKISGLGPLATASGVGSSEITDGSISNSDIPPGPAIAASKIAGLGPLATASGVGSAEIRDGQISDADISPAAAISSSKISGLGSLASLNAVSSTEITDGQIVDADVSPTAAIAGSKLQAASAANAGAVSTGVQAFAGVKTFNSGVVVGSSGGAITSILTGQASANVGNVSSTSPQVESVTVAGAAVGDAVFCSPNTAPPADTISWSAAVSAANTVSIRVVNTAATQNWNGSTTWKCVVFK